MRTAIITDSNSGMLPADAEKHGIFMLPMPVIINGKEYLEHVSLNPEHFYQLQEEGADIHTSQPSAGDVIDLWTEVLKSYDEAVYIPMSSGLSGSCASAMLYAQDFGGRIQVVDNKRISVTMRQSALDAKAMADAGAEAPEIRKALEESGPASHIYIMVDTLRYLKKGGRITPAAAAIAGILHLKPVLQIQGDKLDAFGKCRSIRNAKKIMSDVVLGHVEEEFGGLDADPPGAWIGVAHTRNREAAEQFVRETQELFPGFPIHMDELPISIAAHTGPGTLALTCTAKMP